MIKQRTIQHCKVIATEQEFFALEAEWRELHQNASYPSLFTSWEWITEWWLHFGPALRSSYSRTKLHIFCAYNSIGTLIGVAPYYEAQSVSTYFGARRLVMIGDHKTGPSMMEEPSVLLRKDHEEQAVKILTSALTHAFLPQWNHFYLPFLSGKVIPADWRSPKTHGDNTGPQIVHLPKTWEEYRKVVTRSMRDNMAYYPKRLAKNGHQWAVRRYTDPEQIDEAIDLLIHLHTARSEGSRGASHMNHMPTHVHTAFLKRFLQRLAGSGNTFLVVLEVDGKPIAAQAFLEIDGYVTVYYSGYDLAWFDFSPLTIIMVEVLKEGMARGVHSVNFLRGEHLWKTRWGTKEEIPIQRVTSPLGMIVDKQSFDFILGPILRRKLKKVVTSQPLLNQAFQHKKRREIESRQGGEARLPVVSSDTP